MYCTVNFAQALWPFCLSFISYTLINRHTVSSVDGSLSIWVIWPLRGLAVCLYNPLQGWLVSVERFGLSLPTVQNLG